MANQFVKTATDQNFETEITNSSIPALVDFWAEWCGPCRALAPLIDELATENQGRLNVFKLNVDENPETAARFGVRGIPTIIFIKNGEVAQQIVGVRAKADFQACIDKIV